MHNVNENKESRSDSVAGGFAWKLAERFLAQGITFIVSIVLARLLAPEDYGVISIILVFITFADVFVINGFSSALIQKKDADTLDFSSIFYCSLLVSIGIYAILFIAAPYIAIFYESPILSPVLRVFALRLPLSAMNSVQHAYVARKMIFKKYFFSTLGGTFVSGVVGIAMAYRGFGVWSIVGQYLSSTIANSMVLLFTVDWHPKLLFSWKAAKPLMSYGWKVTASSFSGAFFNQLRSLIIGKFYTTADLAYYDRGRNFSTLATDNIGNALMSVLFPVFSNISNNTDELKQRVREAIRMISFTVFPITIGLAVVAESMVMVLLTEKWIECVPYIQILCVSSAIGMIGDVSLQSLNAIGRSDVVLRLEFIKKPVYLILLVLGIQINVLAVAVTMLIYSVYGTLANVSPLKKHIGYSLHELLKDVLPPISFSAIMAVTAGAWTFVEMSSLSKLVLQVFTGAGVYVTLSAATKNQCFVAIMDRFRFDISKFKDKGEKMIDQIHKWLSYYIHVGFFYLCRIFPIKSNKVMFSNFAGKGYADSPKAICEMLHMNKTDYDMAWSVNDINTPFPSYVRGVRSGSIRWVYEMATSRVWVNNCRHLAYVRKRKSQFYIQTWHGDVCIKAVEGDAIETLQKEYILAAKNDSKMANLMVSGSEWRSKNIRRSFWYSGEILCAEVYRPLILNDVEALALSSSIRAQLQVDDDIKIALYAPTFRRDYTLTTYALEYEIISDELSKKFGGEWCVLMRLHPNVSHLQSNLVFTNKVKNGSVFPSISELLVVSDVLITDYSGSMFDAFRINKPVFLYGTDYEEYIHSDRKLYFDLKDLPASFSKSTQELIDAIEAFDVEEYEKRAKEFVEEIGYYNNDGISMICECIEKYIGRKNDYRIHNRSI